MPRLTMESAITVGTKEIQMEEILKTIIYLPAKQIMTFFLEIGLTIPREIRIFVLRETLRERVIETRKSRLTLADELNYRLSWYTEFSETQLENLLVFFDDRQLEKDFLEELWVDIIAYMIEKEVPPKTLKRLLDLSFTHVKAVGLELPNMKVYNRELKNLFFDSYGRLDGLAPSKFRPVLFKSSTLAEVRDIGLKYDVKVPRRLKKTQLAEIIVTELKERGKYSEKTEQDIKKMSVIILQRFAIDNDIKASTELKKEEIIEYILANAHATKETYFVPESIEDYDKEINEVKAETTNIVAPIISVEKSSDEDMKQAEEVVEQVEEQAEEVVEQVEDQAEEVVEKLEESPLPTQNTQPTMDMSELVAEIKKLREVIQIAAEEKNRDKEIEQIEKPEEEDNEIIIINSAEFHGTQKTLKKLTKRDNREKKEVSKVAEEITNDEDEREDEKPKEVKVAAKAGKSLIKMLLMAILIVVVFGGILLILFAVLTYFVTGIDLLDGAEAFINGIFDFNIILRLHALIRGLGL